MLAPITTARSPIRFIMMLPKARASSPQGFG
jgi:hypothetical protein